MALRILLTLFLAFFAKSVFAITFTPRGSAKHVTQVRVHFETEVSAIGSSTPPFQFNCASEGQGRWVTTRDWVYDFKEEVPAGQSCTFQLTLTTDLAGTKIEGDTNFTFDTGGPQVLDIEPNPEYGTVDEDQIFALFIDSSIDEASLSHIYFEIPQIANPVPVKIVGFEEIKKANPNYARRFEDRKPLPIFIQSSSKLPSGKTIKLIWDKGVLSKNGVPSRERQSFSFKTREPFRAIESCRRASKGADCSPFDDIFIRFTAPPAEKAELSVLGQQKDQKIERRDDEWIIPAPHVAGTVYKITYKSGFQDDAGRDLSTPMESSIKVGEFPPLVKFQARFGILEWKGDPRVPVHLRKIEQDTKVRVLAIPLPSGKNQNVSAFVDWIKKNQNEDHSKALLPDGTEGLQKRELPAYKGQKSFEVRGLPLPEPGLYQLEVSSADLGKAYEKTIMHVHSQALVTDMVIHWKETKDNTLAWVTSLSSGASIPGASVAIYNCRLQKVGMGTTDSQGTLFLPVSQTKIDRCAKNWPHWDRRGLLITASKDKDFTFLFNNQTTGLESWRFGLEGDDNWHNPQIHTLLDRTLFRAGETLSGLNIARKRVLDGLEIPKSSSLVSKIIFLHSGSGKSFSKELIWDEQGRSSLQWDIPKDAPLGTYELKIGDQVTGKIEVREFKVATVKASITPANALPIAVKEVTYNFAVNYLNGGASQNLQTKIRAYLDYAVPYRSAAFPGYNFSPIRDYDSQNDEEGDRNQLKSVESRLDASGQGSATLRLPSIKEIKKLRIELEYPDTNGELRTQPFSQLIFPSSSLLGIKSPESSNYQPNKPYEFQGVLIDLKENPQQNKVTLRRYKKTYLSHRRRSIGGTYTYQSKVLISDEVRVCETETNKDGLFNCKLSFAEPGNYVLRGESQDREGRKVVSEIEIWVDGKQRWYAADDHDRIDLIADKQQYEPGDTAKILVKAPFPKAKILYAIEREGIKSYKVQDFDAKSPYINIPIDRSFAPNIYVSAWLFRGRTKGTEPFLQVDLGKPSFKLGIVNLKVGRSKHTLNVAIRTDKKEYKPRDTVKVSIDVKSPDGSRPAGGSVTIAAVDEGLLEVEPNLSWDLLSAMMGHRGYTGTNASSSMMVVGKRHFGLKALPAGGGGGSRGSTRELFDTLLKWSAIIPLKDGLAEVDVPLNDSLSAFRIVAIAHANSDLFGKAETLVQSKKNLSLFSGIPELVRNGDEYRARFTVRNSSASALNVKVSGTAGESIPLLEQSIDLGANSSKILEWPVKVPEQVRELQYVLSASSEQVSDSIRITQKVVDPIPVQALLGEVRSLGNDMNIPLELPPNARAANVKITSSATLSGDNLFGVRAYMQDYPHSCMEQKLSRAVALQNKDLWDKSRVASSLDENGLLKFFPTGTEGSVELTAYALELAHYQGWPLPEDTENRMIDALSRFTQGKLETKGSGLFIADKLRALASLTLAKRLEDSQKTLKALDLNPTYLPLTALVDYRRVIDPQNQEGLAPIDSALTQRMEFRGSVMQLKSEERTMLGSNDASLARLILSLVQSSSEAKDLPTLVRSLLAAQKRGHWDSTIADALGTLALTQFAKKFEKSPASGEIIASLDAVKKAFPVHSKSGETIAWPKGKSSLTLSKSGQGDPWVTILASAAVPLQSPLSSGLSITKTVKKIEGGASGHRIGDIFEVELKFNTKTKQDWTALIDPIPSGARILPATANATYIERTFEGMKAYFEYLDPGARTFTYRFQLNTAGNFILPPTRIEAMYAQEVFGLIPNENWIVK